MHIDSSLAVHGILNELGERLKQTRLNHNITQQSLAETAGVSRSLVMRAENGEASLATFVALLKALGVAEQLDLFLPPPALSPLQLVKLNGKQRQRASGVAEMDANGHSSW